MRVVPTPVGDRPRGGLAHARRRRRRQRARPRRRRRRHPRASRDHDVPARVPRRGAERDDRRRRSARSRMLAFAVRRALAAFLLLQAAFGSWRLAALVCRDAAGGAGRRRARRAARRRGAVARRRCSDCWRCSESPRAPACCWCAGCRPARERHAVRLEPSSGAAEPLRAGRDHGRRRWPCSWCRSWCSAPARASRSCSPMAVVILGGARHRRAR